MNIDVGSELITIAYVVSNRDVLVPTPIIKIICDYFNNISPSNIIRDTVEWYAFMDSFCQELNVDTVTLSKLYDTKIDGFEAKTFHNKCDNKGPTVCIIYTNSAELKVLGGYTTVSWSSPDDPTYVEDTNAFIFTIKPKLFFSRIKKDNTKYAVKHHKDYFCIFGGHDSYFFNDIWIDNNTAMDSGYHEVSYKKMISSDFTEFFDVIHFEVFQVK